MVTTSAGNYGVNTDEIAHYPSGFDSENIIATAALSGYSLNVDLTAWSNFGAETIDVAAQGQNIPFYISPQEVIMLEGTSYANAKLTAHAGLQYAQGISVHGWVETTLMNTIYHPNLSKLKYSSYVDD